MKRSVKKSYLLLIAIIAVPMVIAIAGNASASPCCGVQEYGGFTLDSSGNYTLSNPLGDSFNPFHDAAYNNRLWLGSDTWGHKYASRTGPGGVDTPWMYNQWYDSNGVYGGYSTYAVDLKSAMALDTLNGGVAGTDYTIKVRAAGAVLVFLNGSPTPIFSQGFPNPAPWTSPWNEATNPFPEDQFSEGQFTVNFGDATLLNSAGNIPFEVVYFFSKTGNQVASGFDFDLNNNPIFIPHNDCEPGTTQVPEPSTILLLGFGLVGMGVAARRKFGK